MNQNNLYKITLFLTTLFAPTILFGTPLINFPTAAAIMIESLVMYCIFFLLVTPVKLYIIHRATKKLNYGFNFMYLGTLASIVLTFFTGIFIIFFMGNFISALFVKFFSSPFGELLDLVVTTTLFSIAVLAALLVELATLRTVYKNLFKTIWKPIIKATLICYLLAIVIVIFLSTTLKD